MEIGYSTMVINLFGVLLLIIASLYALKKFKLQRFNGDQAIKIMNIVSLGSKEKIVLLQVHETKLLIGITPQAIHTLHAFASDDVLGQVAVRQPASAFQEQLNQLAK